MPEQGKWRISTAYDYVDELDAPDLAWEFLRRNPDYRKDIARLQSRDDNTEPIATAVAEKWGLSFRGRPQYTCTRSKCCLDDRDRPFNTNFSTTPNLRCPYWGARQPSNT